MDFRFLVLQRQMLPQECKHTKDSRRDKHNNEHIC